MLLNNLTAFSTNWLCCMMYVVDESFYLFFVLWVFSVVPDVDLPIWVLFQLVVLYENDDVVLIVVVLLT